MKQLLTLIIAFCCLSLLYSTSVNAQAPELQILQGQDTLFVCQGESVQLSLNGGTAIEWQPATILNQSDIIDPIATPIVSQEVSVQAVFNGRIQRDTIFLTVVAAPTLSLSSPAVFPICRGDIVTLRADNNVNGQGLSWRPAEGLSDTFSVEVQAQPENSTEYIARIDLQGCSVEDTIEVSIRPPRVTILDENNAVIGDTLFVCNDSIQTDVVLNAQTNDNNNDAVRWSPFVADVLSDSVGASIIASPLETFTVKASYAAEGCNVMDSIVIRIDSLPNLMITAEPEKDPYCVGELVELTSPTYEPSAYPDIEHIWENGATFETPDSLFNMVLTTQDTFLVSRITENNACLDTATVFIPVVQPKNLVLEPDTTVCPGTTLNLNLEFEGEGEIEWMTMPEGMMLAGKTPQVTVNTTTQYTATVTEEGCPSSISTTIETFPNPRPQFNATTTICRGDDIQLIVGGVDTANITYQWSRSDDPAFTSDDPFLVATALQQDVTFTLVATFGACAPVTFQVPIDVVQDADVTIPDDQFICPGDPITLTAESTAPADVQETFTWTYNNGQTASGEQVTLDDILSTTTVSLTYTYGPGCGTINRQLQVNVDVVPALDFNYNPVDIITEGIPLGDLIGIEAQLTPQVADLSYAWTVNGEPLNFDGPSITDEPGDNPSIYELTVTTPNGCTATFTSPPIAVIIPMFDVPNAFTPNNDDTNDNFNITSVGNVEIVDFLVYNRWGQLVYDNDTPDTGWDGTIDGEAAPSDVYSYKIRVRLPDGEETLLSGDVTLIR